VELTTLKTGGGIMLNKKRIVEVKMDKLGNLTLVIGIDSIYLQAEIDVERFGILKSCKMQATDRR
jgi:hypothetical protein